MSALPSDAPIHERFRAELIAACARATDQPCVLLSGGLDSGSILAAMLETGIPFGICSSARRCRSR